MFSTMLLPIDTGGMENITTSDHLTTADHHRLVELATGNLGRGDTMADIGEDSEVPRTREVAMVNLKNN